MSMLTAGGSAMALVLIVLIVFSAPLVYFAVFSKGPSADRLVKIIRAWRQRHPSRPRK